MGPSDFMQAMRETIASYVLEEMPEAARNQLKDKELSVLLIIFGNWQARAIPKSVRCLHESSELKASSKSIDHEKALLTLRYAIRSGADLRPWQSRRVTIAVDTKQEWPLKRREDLDLLYADWGIQHLHLGNKIEANGRVKRTKDLLFALFTLNDAYLIDIRGHKDNWASLELMEILVRNFPSLAESWASSHIVGLAHDFSDQERLQLREAGVTALLEVDGRVYMPQPAGMTMGGGSIAVTMQVNRIMHRLRELDRQWRDDPEWLNGWVRNEGHHLPKDPRWLPFLSEGQAGAIEAATQVFVPLVPLYHIALT